MPIDQARIEALGKYCYEQWAHGARLVAWEDIAPDHKKLWERHAIELVGIAFPELASDPPKAWVAPWEITAAMGEVQRHKWWYGTEEMWRAARDAHLKEQGHE